MEPSTGTGSDLRSDAELIVAARAGDAGAFGALYERHAGAALVVARQYVNGAAEAEDVVADSFAAVWSALRGGSGPSDAFRAYLFTVVRRVAAVQRDKGRRAEPTDDVAVLEAGSLAEPGAEEPALAGFERSVVARAFASLPERWQAVLWHSEVEGLTPQQIAPLLGLSANSTAALAYRAREGLRQAYLQQHLHDPLADGCRAVAGKLGGYVRGGLGQRDTTQVDSHLETCGDCRALVLELRDVNHGLRAVVAPLVLGVVGLGALKYGLPTSGGLAAGSASLASGGAAAGGAATGAGAAGAGTGAGAAATGIGAAGAVGTGIAAGAAGGGGAAAGGLFGAIAGVLAGVPTVVVAAVAGVVVLAGVAIGVTQLGRADDAGAAPGPTTSAGPTAGPDGSSSAARTEGADAQDFGTADDDPGQGDDDYPALPDTEAPDRDDSGAGTDPGPGGESGGGEPQAPVITVPTQAPTWTPVPTTPPARPAQFAVGDPEGELEAGTAGVLAVSVTNTGDLPATHVYVLVGLPDGAELRSATARVVGRLAAPAAAPWDCSVGGGDVRCDLPVLGGGEEARLELAVYVPETYDTEDGEVTWQVGAQDVEPGPAKSTKVPIKPAPARLEWVSVVDDLTLPAGGTVELDVTIRNAGGTPVNASAPATIVVDVPEGVTVEGVRGSSWTCEQVAGTGLVCTDPGVDKRAESTLTLLVTAGEGAASGTLGLVLTPGGETASVDYTVVVPARFSVTTAATDLPLALGTVTTATVTVRNTGGLDAQHVTATLTAPAGATWAEHDGSGGWVCESGGAAGELVCQRDRLQADESRGLTVALDPLVPTGADPGALVVRVEAEGADRGELVVPATVVVPVLDLGLTVSESGAILATLGVSAADAADVDLTVTLPSGLSFDRAAATWPLTCALGTTGLEATCDLGRVERGGQVALPLPAVVEAAISGVAHATATTAGPASASATAAVGTTSSGLAVRYQARGAYNVLEVGAPVLGCARLSSCQSSNNNDVDMVPIDIAAPDGARSSVPVSSSTTLTLPEGADVVFAGLYWSANKVEADSWSSDLGRARFRGPGDAAYRDVTASTTWQTDPDNAGRTYYQSFADVTELVGQLGAGTWSVADVAVSKDRRDTNPTYYGGWALIVVFEDPAAANATVTVYDGAAWVGTDRPEPEFRFVTEPGATARAGVVAWEGDRATTNDRLLLDGTALVPLRADGSAGSASNAFDSTATGWAHANSLGVDAKGFRPVTSTGNVGVLRATTTGDQYLLGAVTIRLAD